MDNAVFVRKVKMLCLEKGLKPTNVCNECGLGGSFLPDIKRGRSPSVDKVQKLAAYLGVSTSELLGEHSPGAPEPLAPDEQQLLLDYRALSSQGREYIRQTMFIAAQTYKKTNDFSDLESLG